jgi:hypothetical protein
VTLVLCTNRAASASIRLDLATALNRTASQPPGTPLGQGLTALQANALNVVLAHARRLWEASKPPAPDDEHLRGFLRTLRVITIDANDEEPDHATAVGALSTALPMSDNATAAWLVLVAEGQAASAEGRWRDRTAITTVLSRHGLLDARRLREAEYAKLISVIMGYGTT